MIELSFEVLGAHPALHAAEPTLMLELRVNELAGVDVHALALRCQIRIEPQRRRYQSVEEERLVDLFGPTRQWGDSLRPFLWKHTSAMLPSFRGALLTELPVRCTYDFEVAAARFLHSLADGLIPLSLCFSGTAFGAGSNGFSAIPVSWASDASFALPVAVWRETMDAFFPNAGWLRLDRSTLDALARFKAARALPSWDRTIDALLAEAAVPQ
jgi:Family of unknown function (DUF6084)